MLGMMALVSSCDNKQSLTQDTSSRAALEQVNDHRFSCSEAHPVFRGRADGIDHHSIVYVAEMTADNRLSLNGVETSASAMIGTIDKVSQLNPPPYLVLQVATSAPCAAVQEIRSALAKTELCQLGNCAEGQDWRDWPIRLGPDTTIPRGKEKRL